jgi:hypothetical protein
MGPILLHIFLFFFHLTYVFRSNTDGSEHVCTLLILQRRIMNFLSRPDCVTKKKKKEKKKNIKNKNRSRVDIYLIIRIKTTAACRHEESTFRNTLRKNLQTVFECPTQYYRKKLHYDFG